MSNTERPGPRDYNRAARNTSASQNLDAWPRPLRWASLARAGRRWSRRMCRSRSICMKIGYLLR